MRKETEKLEMDLVKIFLRRPPDTMREKDNAVYYDGGSLYHVFRAGHVHGGIPGKGSCSLGNPGIHRVMGMAGAASQFFPQQRYFL